MFHLTSDRMCERIISNNKAVLNICHPLLSGIPPLPPVCAPSCSRKASHQRGCARPSSFPSQNGGEFTWWGVPLQQQQQIGTPADDREVAKHEIKNAHLCPFSSPATDLQVSAASPSRPLGAGEAAAGRYDIDRPPDYIFPHRPLSPCAACLFFRFQKTLLSHAF